MLLCIRVPGMRALLDNPGIDHKLVFLGLEDFIGCQVVNRRSTYSSMAPMDG